MSGGSYAVASGDLLEFEEEAAAERKRAETLSQVRRFTGLGILALACTFIGLDIAQFSSDTLLARILKFTTIVLVFALSLLSRGDYDKKDRRWLRMALGLSVAADFALGILGQFIVGLGLFALVHIVYSVRHVRGIQSGLKEAALAFGVAAFGACVMWLSAPRMQAAGLLIPSLAYAVPLSLSLYAGLGVLMRDFYKDASRYRVAAGAALFFIVDVAVAHYNAMEPGDIRTITGIGVWVLYLPAQYLLCKSGDRWAA